MVSIITALSNTEWRKYPLFPWCRPPKGKYKSITPDDAAAKAASASQDISHDDDSQATSQDVSGGDEDMANAADADAAPAADAAPVTDTAPTDNATPVPSLAKGANGAKADATLPVAGKVSVREGGTKDLFCA